MAMIKYIALFLFVFSCERYSKTNTIEEFNTHKKSFIELKDILHSIPVRGFGVVLNSDTLHITYMDTSINTISGDTIYMSESVNYAKIKDHNLIKNYSLEIEKIKLFLQSMDYWQISIGVNKSVHFLKGYNDPKGYFNLQPKQKVISFMESTDNIFRMESMNKIDTLGDNWYLQYNSK